MSVNYEIKATNQKYIFSYKTMDGDIKFMYRLSLGKDDVTGKQKNTTGRGFDTIVEALEARKSKKDKFEARKKFKKDRPILFRELAAKWLDDYKETVEPSTYDKTVSIFKNHILPIMGDLEFEEITTYQCQQFVRKFSTRVKTFRKITSYASLALGHAVLLGYISFNPFDNLKTGNKKGVKNTPSNLKVKELEKRNYFLPIELNLLLDFLKAEKDSKAYTYFRLLAFSGCRKGEAFALTWNDIDFTNKKVTFNKAVGHSKEYGFYLKHTKPENVRCISLDDATLEILKDWQTKQKKLLEIQNIPYARKAQLIFQNTNNYFIYPTKTTQWLMKAKKALPFSKLTKFSAHTLRHTHATICAMNNIPLIDIQHRLGHTDLNTTTTYYIHATEEKDQKASESFAEILDNARNYSVK